MGLEGRCSVRIRDIRKKENSLQTRSSWAAYQSALVVGHLSGSTEGFHLALWPTMSENECEAGQCPLLFGL